MSNMPEQSQTSVVIPAYNAGWCIAKAIDSVLQQTLQPAEIIVVNDGSVDNTLAVLEPYQHQIRIISQKNHGLSSARNTGIKASRTQYVALLDADDYWLPAKLERQEVLMNANRGLGFCSTAAMIVDENGKETGEWLCPNAEGELLETIFARNATVAGSGSGVAGKTELFISAGLFDETLTSLEDIDMWMRLAAVSGYACIPEKLTAIFKHGDSMSGNLKKMFSSAQQVMRKNRSLLPPDRRGRFWQQCYSSMLTDYAKWEYRSGRKTAALTHLAEGLIRAPIKNGRLTLGLATHILLSQPV